MSKKDYLGILKKEMVVAVGCTEPVAVAYAAALARNEVCGYPIYKIQVKASGNIIKNSMSVTIPGTDQQGARFAAALGAVAGKSDKGLEVLQSVTEEQIKEAKQLCGGKVVLYAAKGVPELYVDVTVFSEGHSGRAVLQNYHDCVVLIEKDGKKVVDERQQAQNTRIEITTEHIKDILEFVQDVDISKLNIIKQSIALNTAICSEGLKSSYGLSIGRTMMDSEAAQHGLITCAVALTSAGSDARMAGASYPVMSNSGSGNQGICAIMPVVAVAEKLEASEELLLRAGALSNLITIHAKKSFGRLSPLCGAVAAGIGASAGVTYLMGGTLRQIKGAVQNVLGNVTGMICDGAKAGCAMKVSTCVFAAVQAAIIALKGQEVKPIEGIIEADVEDTLRNISRLSEEGMSSLDPLLLEIMIDKKSSKEE